MKHTRTARTISLLMALLLFIELTFSTSVSLAFAENGEEDQTKTEAYDEPSQEVPAAELSE